MQKHTPLLNIMLIKLLFHYDKICLKVVFLSFLYCKILNIIFIYNLKKINLLE